MNKILLKLNTFFLIAVLILCFALCANADTVLEKGDCVVFGSYMDTPLTWRVYSKEDNKIVLISDKVISTMAYHESKALWEESSIRQWLNSDAGFLSDDNFSDTELAMFTTCDVDYVVNSHISGISPDGTEQHKYNNKVSNALQNYDSAYRCQTKDKVFIPGIYDVCAINSDPHSFGVDYWLATGEQNPYSYASYWLRDSMYGLDTNYARCVTIHGKVAYEDVSVNTLGVRPMCALMEDLVGISSGNGSENLPYILSDSDYLVLSVSNDAVWKDGMVYIKILGKGTRDNNISIFRNGEEITDRSDNVVTVPACDGVNVFNAYLYDENGSPKISSQPLTIWGQNYKTNSVKYNWDFEEKTPFKPTEDNMIIWSEEDGKSGLGVGITSFIRTQGATSSLALDKNKTGVLIDVDIRFDTIDVLQNQPIRIKLMPQNEFYMPITVNTGGYVFLNGTTTSTGSLLKLTENTWYNFKVVINDTDKTVSLAIDGVVYALDEPLTSEFSYTSTLLLSASWNNTDRINKISIDNLSVSNVSPADYTIDMFPILHPDKKTVTAIGINNTDNLYSVTIATASFGVSNVNQILLSDKTLPPKGYALEDFTFDKPLDAGGNYRIFMFDDIHRLKPVVESQKSE